jgi:hypothetical protein
VSRQRGISRRGSGEGSPFVCVAPDFFRSPGISTTGFYLTRYVDHGISGTVCTAAIETRNFFLNGRFSMFIDRTAVQSEIAKQEGQSLNDSHQHLCLINRKNGLL